MSERQIVGCIPYDINTQQILLVTSRQYPDQWLVPKGGIELNEEGAQAALREAYEEAGIKGQISHNLGWFEGTKITKKGNTKEIKFLMFGMKVERVLEKESWLEATKRQRKWVGFEEAYQLIKYPIMVEAIKKLKELLKW